MSSSSHRLPRLGLSPHTFLLLSMAAPLVSAGLPTMTYSGCYSSSSGLSNQGTYTYQTSGWCQPICVKQNQAVLALSGGNDCWCGDSLPSADTKVDESYCNVPCDGYNKDFCGGDGYYSVYLSGIEADVSQDPTSGSKTTPGGSGSSKSNNGDNGDDSDQTQSTGSDGASSTDANAGTTITAAPSVVTSRAPGRTVVLTVDGSAAQHTTGSTPNGRSGGHANVTGIAVGVVVGVIALAAIAGGLFFCHRRRKRLQAEEDYQRQTQVSAFMRSSDIRPPPTAYSHTSDSRLDPEAGYRRNSAGSIADDQDYSRRILRVANPDSS